MKKKILIIDDDPALGLLIQSRLEAHGYDVSVASNGSEGIRKAVEVQPDLILLDVRMPHMDGWTCFHEIRKSRSGKDVPILMTTAQHKLQDMFEAEGVVGFVTKPYRAEDLIQTIEGVFSGEPQS